MSYSANFVIGVLFGYKVYFDIATRGSLLKIFLLTFVLSLIGILFRKRVSTLFKKFLILGCLFSFACLLGSGYASYRDKDYGDLKVFKGEVVVVESSRDGLKNKIIATSKEKNTKVSFTLYSPEVFIPGDVLNIDASVQKDNVINPKRISGSVQSFDYGEYLRSRGVDFNLKVNSFQKGVTHEITLNRLAYKFRGLLFENLSSTMKDKQAGVVMAMVLGDDSWLDKNIKDTFKMSGLSHVLVFSGFNFVVLISFFSLFIQSLNKKTRFSIVVMISILILLIAPTSAPTARAAIFVFYSSVAAWFNKNYNVKYILWVFVGLFCIYDPFAAIYNASFHLSVLATFGLIYGVEVASLIAKNKLYQYLFSIISVSLFTTPYLIHVFGGVSLVNIPVNFISLPIASLITVLGVVTLIMSFIFPLLGTVLGFLLTFIVDFLIKIAETFSVFYVSSSLIFDSWVSLLCAYLLFCVLYCLLTLGLYIQKTKA